MRIFLAGVSIPLAALWKVMLESMEKGLSEQEAVKVGIRDYLKHDRIVSFSTWGEINVLESYFYARKSKVLDKLIPLTRHFLLDSGAFSFMQGTGGHCDWDRYANEYCDFINKYAIDDFFELDIDNIVGLKEVERLRGLIERRTGKKVIPVWHVERGKQYFLDMVKEYPYVACGSIAKVVPGKQKITPKYFNWFIQTAREHGSKVHALGYTPKNLHGTPFFSVDSTNWVYGNLTGKIFKFNARKGVMESISKVGARVKTRDALVRNLDEHVKYQRYAENYL